MAQTKISWTDQAWNALSWNCNKVSPGCKNCYAQAHSRKYPQNSVAGEFLGAPRWRPNALDDLRQIKAGSTVFVNTHSDTFHEKNPTAWIADMFQHMNQRPDLIFLLLTKRPQVAALLAPELKWSDNIWLGTSVEGPAYMNRLEILRKIPAAHRFISFEPLLEYIPQQQIGLALLTDYEWVIVGGESGEGYRPFAKEWAKDIQHVCQQYAIPFFYKQGSAPYPDSDRLLDGRTYDERPESFAQMQQKYANQVSQLSLF